MSTAVQSDLLTRKEAAAYIRKRPQTLALWHSTRRYAIPVIKVGRSAMYRKADLDAWLESRTISGDREQK